MRIGLYLADLRRSKTESHGIINHALGLAAALPQHLRPGEELVLFCSKEVRPELPDQFPANVKVRVSETPIGAARRLLLDHLSVRRWARNEGLDVLHFPKGHLPLGGVSGTKLVATVHDDIPIRYASGELGSGAGRIKAAYFSWAIGHSLRTADHVITISEFSRECLVRRVPAARSRISVIPNGVSLPPLAPVPRASKRPVLLHLGSPNDHKRSRQSIEWARDFLDRSGDYSLAVTGSLSEDAEAAARHPRVIRMREVLSNIELAHLMRDSSALLFPSVMEGFGLPPVEAAQLGTPSVWARAAALPEVMGDEPGGFKPDDKQDFFRALTEVLSLPDPELEAMVSRFKGRFSWSHIAATTLDLYRSLGRRSGARQK